MIGMAKAQNRSDSRILDNDFIAVHKPRVRAALLKIKSTTYKLFFAIFLATVLL